MCVTDDTSGMEWIMRWNLLSRIFLSTYSYWTFKRNNNANYFQNKFLHLFLFKNDKTTTMICGFSLRLIEWFGWRDKSRANIQLECHQPRQNRPSLRLKRNYLRILCTMQEDFEQQHAMMYNNTWFSSFSLAITCAIEVVDSSQSPHDKHATKWNLLSVTNEVFVAAA